MAIEFLRDTGDMIDKRHKVEVRIHFRSQEACEWITRQLKPGFRIEAYQGVQTVVMQLAVLDPDTFAECLNFKYGLTLFRWNELDAEPDEFWKKRKPRQL